jgi:hypothetical protein
MTKTDVLGGPLRCQTALIVSWNWPDRLFIKFVFFCHVLDQNFMVRFAWLRFTFVRWAAQIKSGVYSLLPLRINLPCMNASVAIWIAHLRAKVSDAARTVVIFGWALQSLAICLSVDKLFGFVVHWHVEHIQHLKTLVLLAVIWFSQLSNCFADLRQPVHGHWYSVRGNNWAMTSNAFRFIELSSSIESELISVGWGWLLQVVDLSQPHILNKFCEPIVFFPVLLNDLFEVLICLQTLF